MNPIGTKIADARKNKGLSQEKLADDAKISLRTLQRIEKGDTSPHGDTLLRISQSLDVPIESFVEFGYKEDYPYIKAMHFVTLLFILLPLGNILLPLIFWLTKKDQIKDLSFFAKNLLNFQITWSLLIYIPYLTVILNFYLKTNFIAPSVFHLNSFFSIFIIPLILYGLNFIYVAIIGIVVNEKSINYFPVAIKFIR
jgi:transcriptional regulator with XRE-family HTH domain